MAKKKAHAHTAPKPHTKAVKAPKPHTTAEEVAAENEKREQSDKSRAGSFRRLAKAYRNASVWDNHSQAAMFEAEADVLDPKHSTAPAKEDLAKQTEEAKTAVTQAETTLADPNATPEAIDKAAKDLPQG